MYQRIPPVVACMALAACAASATQPTTSVDGTEAAAKANKQNAAEAVLVEYNVPDEAVESGLVDDDTLVCKREKVVGSHIPKVVCLSASERERLRKQSQGYLGKTGRTPDPRSDG
jgi:hypothetical protein